MSIGLAALLASLNLATQKWAIWIAAFQRQAGRSIPRWAPRGRVPRPCSNAASPGNWGARAPLAGRCHHPLASRACEGTSMERRMGGPPERVGISNLRGTRARCIGLWQASGPWLSAAGGARGAVWTILRDRLSGGGRCRRTGPVRHLPVAFPVAPPPAAGSGAHPRLQGALIPSDSLPG